MQRRMQHMSPVTEVFQLLPNPSSCAQHTVRRKKLKCQSLEQGKVYCRAKQGERVVGALKTLNPQWFSGKSFYRQNLGWGLQCVWLSNESLMKVGGEVTGGWSRNLRLSLKLPSSTWVGGGLSSWGRIQRYIVMDIPWGGSRTLPHLVSWLLLPYFCIPSLPWLATVWICPLEFRES